MNRCKWTRKDRRKRYSDVKVYNPDGSLKEIIPVKRLKATKPEPNHDIVNERDNERYIVWRSTILDRDKKTCALCGEKQWTQVHHITRWADNESLRYDLTNGVCLCIPCHSRYHGKENKAFPEYITEKLLHYISTLYGEL